MTNGEARRFLDGTLEELALVVGGLVTIYAVDDAFIHRLFRSLAAIRQRALERLQGQAGKQRREPRSGTEPHPAIEAFLCELRPPVTATDRG